MSATYESSTMQRALIRSKSIKAMGIAAGIATHALFLFTVWKLVPFLWEIRPRANGGGLTDLAIDALLAVQFIVPHSVLLHPSVRRRIERVVPSAFYGCLFCLVTCLGLLATILFWRTDPHVVWQFTGPARFAVGIAFAGTWIALFHSLSLNGLGYQTGLKPWWYWVRQQKLPPRQFREAGAFRVMRHPVYLSFLGLIWFTPTVTLDRAVLIALWTGYVFVGSRLKDRRLTLFMGATYLDYQSRVPGYPGMLLGPLSRIAWQPVIAEPLLKKHGKHKVHWTGNREARRIEPGMDSRQCV